MQVQVCWWHGGSVHTPSEHGVTYGPAPPGSGPPGGASATPRHGRASPSCSRRAVRCCGETPRAICMEPPGGASPASSGHERETTVPLSSSLSRHLAVVYRLSSIAGRSPRSSQSDAGRSGSASRATPHAGHGGGCVVARPQVAPLRSQHDRVRQFCSRDLCSSVNNVRPRTCTTSSGGDPCGDSYVNSDSKSMQPPAVGEPRRSHNRPVIPTACHAGRGTAPRPATANGPAPACVRQTPGRGGRRTANGASCQQGRGTPGRAGATPRHCRGACPAAGSTVYAPPTGGMHATSRRRTPPGCVRRAVLTRTRWACPSHARAGTHVPVEAGVVLGTHAPITGAGSGLCPRQIALTRRRRLGPRPARCRGARTRLLRGGRPHTAPPRGADPSCGGTGANHVVTQPMSRLPVRVMTRCYWMHRRLRDAGMLLPPARVHAQLHLPTHRNAPGCSSVRLVRGPTPRQVVVGLYVCKWGIRDIRHPTGGD